MNKNLLLFVALFLLSAASVKSQTVIYSEDFHNGIPASWGNSGWNNFGNNAQIKWKYTHTGSHGGYSDPNDFINSPTFSNGFIIFDSDSLDNGGTTNAGSGPATASQIVDLTTSAINVSGHPYIKLQFNEYFKNLNSITVVGASTDSINWHYDTINLDVPANGFTLKSKKIALDISDYVNGQPKVYLRFHMYADYYWWMIDDITLSDITANDMGIQYSYYYPGGSPSLTFSYTQCPLSLVGYDSLYTITDIKNFGTATQRNCKVSIERTRNSAIISRDTISFTPTMPREKDSFNVFGTMLNGLGNYEFHMQVSSDSLDADLSNNFDTVRFSITDSAYSINKSSKNIGQSLSCLYISPSYSVSQRMGPYLGMVASDTVTSITTAVLGGRFGTRPGSVIKATIYQATQPVNSIYSGTKVIYTFSKILTASDITPDTAIDLIPVTMLIDNSSGNPILNGDYYWIALEGVSTPDTVISIAATEYPWWNNSFVEDTTGYPFNNPLASTGQWSPYCTVNFGRPGVSRYVDFTMSPNSNPVRTNTSVAFTANTSISNPVQYLWQVNGVSSGLNQTLHGSYVIDTFTVVDSINVCLSVYITTTDSITACHGLRTASCNADFTIVADTTPHSYIGYSYATGPNLSYLWFFGDGGSSTLPYPTHVYAAAGNYTVCLRVVDTVTGCIAFFCDSNRYFARTTGMITLTIVNGLTGIADISGSSPISIYPNPANDAFNIKVNSDMIGSTYTLTDLTGRLVSMGQLKREMTTIPAAELTPGVYIIHLGNDVFKFIKE